MAFRINHEIERSSRSAIFLSALICPVEIRKATNLFSIYTLYNSDYISTSIMFAHSRRGFF